MVFKITYDDKEYDLALVLDGKMKIISKPFYLDYEFGYEEIEQKSPFSEPRLCNTTTGYNFCATDKERALSSIDGLLHDHRQGLFKIEIKGGRIFLYDKPLEELLKYVDSRVNEKIAQRLEEVRRPPRHRLVFKGW